MKNNKKIIIKLVAISALLNFTAVTTAQELLPPEHQEQVVPKVYEKEEQKEFVVIEGVANHEFNPQLTSLSSDNDILENVYEGLFTANPVTLEPQFAIATDYKISRDKKRWIIYLREDAKFSNGEIIKANDVRNSWLKLLANPDAPYASLLDIIRGVEEFRNGTGDVEDVGIYATDDFTLSIYLNNPANYLPRVLCHTAFTVVHDDPLVSSGAYTISEIADKKTVLVKNPYYWDNENVVLEKVIFLQSDDEEENTYLFNTGKAQWVSSGNIVVDKLLDSDSVQMSAQYGVSYLFFKTSANNPAKKETGSIWDYKEFRTAVLEAMPWDDLREGQFVPATTFVYPLNGYPEVPGYDFTDIIEAKLKMKDAKEKYNIPEDQIIPLLIEITPGSLSEAHKESIKSALAPIGVEVNYREIPSFLYFSNVSKSDGDMFLYTWVGDFADPLTFLELFHGKSSMNESGWQNDEYDRLITESAKVSSEERYKLLGQAETILLDEGMVIPISHPVSFNIIDPKEVGGWYPNAFDSHLFKFMYLKPQKIDITDMI